MKRILCFMLAVAMLISTVPMLASAAEFNPSNFESFKLQVDGYGDTTGFMIPVYSLNFLGITTAEDHAKLMGCRINGTVTKADGTVVQVNNLPIIQTHNHTSHIRVWVGSLNIVNGWWNVDPVPYTADLTLSPVLTVDVTNFEPFKLNITAVGSWIHDGVNHKRFVTDTAFPFKITEDHQLAGCVLNGTITYKGSDDFSKSVPFKNVPVAYQPLRTDGTSKVNLDFLVPAGYTIKEQAPGEYTFNLTISPAVEEGESKPIKISVSRTGTDGTLKRLLITNALGIDNSIADQLKGWYLNGIVKYKGTGNYSKTVYFTNVEIVSQLGRTIDDLVSLDFEVPEGKTICLGAEEDAYYTWDLTLSQDKLREITITDVELENNGINLVVNNNTLSSSGELKLVASIYDGNRLVEVGFYDVPDIAAGDILPIGTITFTSTNWTYGSVFIWKSLAEPTPVSKSVEFENDALPWIEYYVSPDGNDANAGTEAAPFRTIQAAQEAVRSCNDNMTGDIVVNIADGTYYIDEMLDFGVEDSGMNGHRVIYRGTGENKPVISGGERVPEFVKSEYERIYVADYDDDVILQLSVNGKRRYVAKADNMIKGAKKKYTYDSELYYLIYPNDPKDSYNYNNGDTSWGYDGIYLSKSDFGNYENPEDILFVWDRGWVTNIVPVSSITTDNKKVGDDYYAVTMQPGIWDNHRRNASTYSNNTHPDGAREFTAMNAFELLDEPGEFYYNRKEKKLYYMPEEDEDMGDAVVVVPKLDTLVCIDGNDVNDKVKNITFENLKFTDSQWDYIDGFTGQQATKIFGMSLSANAPRAIYVERADGIEFNNNVICNIGGSAIDYHNAVSNSKIVGNAIYDIGESAILSGARNHSDYSLGSKTSDDTVPSSDGVSNSVPEAYKDSAVDLAGMSTTKIHYSYFGMDLNPNATNPLNYPGFVGSGLADTTTANQYLNNVTWIDGNYSLISNEVWRDDYSSSKGEKPYVMFEFMRPYSIDEVVVSFKSGAITDDEKSNFEILVSNDKSFAEGTYKTLAVQNGAAGELNHYTFDDDGKYKYVMIRKLSVSDFAMSRVWIATTDRKPYVKNQRCNGIVIQNNIAERVGVDVARSIGMVVHSGENYTIKHNELRDMPYSGISIGYTWNTDQNTCYNMDVGYNYVYDTCKVMHDGGGIYTLGAQPGSRYYNNYIERVNLGLNGFYTDNGTRYLTIKDNYIESALYMLSPYVSANDTGSGIIENTFSNNYATHTVSNDAGKGNNTYEDAIYTVIGQPQRAAYDTYTNAGLEPGYEHLRAYIPEGTGNRYSREDYYSVSDSNERSTWSDLALENAGLELKYTLDNGAFGTGLGMYPAEYKTKLQEIYNKITNGTCTVVEAMDFHEELKASIKRYSYEETLALCKKLLSDAKESGNYSAADVSEFEAAIASAEEISRETAMGEYDALIALETAYNAFVG